jgi:hypothetical protein
MVLIYQPPKDFATQRNGDGGREKDIFRENVGTSAILGKTI